MTSGAICCDLDGVLWRGDATIPGAADAVARLRAAGHRCVFLTNNAGPSIADVIAKLAVHGVDAVADDVVTSAQAAARVVVARFGAGARVFACAGAGVGEAFAAVGITVTDEPRAADAVVVGWHRSFDFGELTRAADAIRAGALFVATNVDATYPTGNGLLPGNGAIVAGIAVAAGVEPVVAGKPEVAMAELVHARVGDVALMIGDRVSTDGAFADALGCPFALVLSGVTVRDARPGCEVVPEPAPPYVADDLAAFADAFLATPGARPNVAS
jgi:glycerol 3-phosphatase-2